MASKIEQRFLTGTEVRAVGDKFQLVGLAAAYDTPSAPIPGGPGGDFTEIIRPGAFSRALKQKQDVRALLNHNPNYVLGRTKPGTLTLEGTPSGLAFTCQLDRRNSMHATVFASVQRGDISECSFAFTPVGQRWSADYAKRELTDVDLLDVSVVCYPAYPGATNVDARSAAAVYTITRQDWRNKHMAALAKLERAIASDKFAAALEDTKQAIDEIRRTL